MRESEPGPAGAHPTLRPARADDAAPMRELARAAYQHYVPRIGREPMPMTADYDAAVAGGHAWVAEEGGRIVALLVLEPAADHLLIENLAVDPDRQGSGLGGEMLALAERQARAMHVTEMRLYTHELMTENLRYYARRGYTETHRGPEHGLKRVFFSKPLT
ncbi:MAG TPA: GNAT family N-acetyltransferase [Nocardioidaceae bacterium]|nr:GNAT family N-acetyltransferase [Nocardioidaceae bacterium]